MTRGGGSDPAARRFEGERAGVARFALSIPNAVDGRSKVMAKSGKPNILVIWGDDIGISNLSCYSH